MEAMSLFFLICKPLMIDENPIDLMTVLFGECISWENLRKSSGESMNGERIAQGIYS